jgi:flagella basal body P-ring formation protein FlgA
MRLSLAHALITLASVPAAGTPYISPAEIDRAVASFTGAMIGQPGGARQPADPRLRLAACAVPLALEWHSPARTSVRVECSGPVAWRIHIAIAPAAADSGSAQAIKRGDHVMIVLRGRGFAVQHPGEAVEAGSVGDWIFVRTARRAEPLRAKIERPGLVIVPVD